MRGRSTAGRDPPRPPVCSRKLLPLAAPDEERHSPVDMTKSRQKQDDPWARAKKLCRLNARQVEMAKKLGMNPRKLPSLRPSPHQKWKLPVGAFIEECYDKSFGGEDELEAMLAAPTGTDRVPERGHSSQISDVVCFLENLVMDLQAYMHDGDDSEQILTHASRELRALADALDRGDMVSPVPELPPPSRPIRESLRAGDDRSCTPDDEDAYTPDDDIPF
jgi:hypothetical protein